MSIPTVLFSLVPQDDLARAIVELNPTYSSPTPDGSRFLLFSTDRLSKTPGQLASFGQYRTNDILLPCHPNRQDKAGSGAGREHGQTLGGTYEKYHNNHCFFFLASSGELILRDQTLRHMKIEVENASESDKTLYDLQGDPRQRVIPRTLDRIYITIGTKTKFRFVWTKDLFGQSITETEELFAQMAKRQAGSCPSLTRPDEEDDVQDPYSYNIRKAEELGAGGFGTVYKAVDMSTGRWWAVKEITSDAADDSVKTALEGEAEVLPGLRHPRLARFQCSQDSRTSGNLQIFFRLYKGDLEKLLKIAPPDQDADIPPWFPRSVLQMWEALTYLHGEKIIHRDIKPQNILFDYANGDPVPNFYLTDFGLSVKADNVASFPAAGTLGYMAPEVALDDKAFPDSDVWSFAITIGQVLKYWSMTERSLTTDEWRDKLRRFGDNRPYTEPELRLITEQRRWYYRIDDLANRGILPPIFKRLLGRAGHRLLPGSCRALTSEEFTERPKIPQDSLSSSDTMWHLSARDADDMSVDVPRAQFF